MSLEDSLRTLAEKIAILRTNLHRLELPVKEPGEQPHESAPPPPPDWDHVLVTSLHHRAIELSDKGRACAALVNELQQEADASRGKRRLANLMGDVRTSVNEIRAGLAGELGSPKHVQELTDKAGEDSSWQPWVDGVMDAIGKCQQAADQVRCDSSDCWYEIDRLPDASELVPQPAVSRESAPAAPAPEPPAPAVAATQTMVAPKSDVAREAVATLLALAAKQHATPGNGHQKPPPGQGIAQEKGTEAMAAPTAECTEEVVTQTPAAPEQPTQCETKDAAAPCEQPTPECAAESPAPCETDPPDACAEERPKQKVAKQPVIAKPEPCYGTLRVSVTSSGHGVPGVGVAMRGMDQVDTERTDDDGQVQWTDAETGRYEVGLDVPEDYELDEVVINNRSLDEEEETCTVNVEEGQTTEVEFRLKSVGAEIRGRVLERRGGCDYPLSGVKVAISSCKQIDYKTTDYRGLFHFCAEAPRTYEVKVDPSIETEGPCGIPLAPESSTSLLVQTEAGQCHDVGDIRYVALKGQITVGAIFDRERCDQQLPLDGLTFELRAAGCDGPGTRKSGDDEQYLTFSNLDAGKYTVTVSGTPTNTKEHLRLSAKPGGSATVLVTPGQTFDLRQYFQFERAASTVQGSVIDEESNDPLPGVLVLLKYKGEERSTLEARTDRDGQFEFEDVHPGPFRVTLASKTSTVGGHKWVLAPGAKGQLDGHVKLGETATLSSFKLIRDRHQIVAILKDEGGSGIPHAALKIEDAEGNLVANVVTDKDGQVTYDVEREGTFYVVPVLEAGQPLKRYLAEVHSQAVIHMVAGPGPQGGQQAAYAAGAIGQAFADVTTFPILTESVDIPSTPSSARVSQGGDGGSWNRLVEGTVREVLGWRPNAKDPRGVLAALTQSFSPQETDGFTEWVHKPRTYTVQMQADMGAVTGAQASLYSRAKNSLDAAQPLLDGLTPLIVDADLEDIEASRSIVRSQLEELLRELGTEGGPRPSRVDQAFETLSGPRIVQGRVAAIAFDPETVPGQLGILRDRFGMLRANVNTIDEEQNLTNYVILVDYVQTLRQSWESQRNFFDRLPHAGVQPYLGTQLVLVSRALSVVAESVAEVGFTMNSVFLGPAERATIALNLGVGESPLFVSELLNWIEHFAAEEAPRLISDSGKDGVEALKATLATLARFARRATQQVSVPAAFNTARVRRAWIELADQIDQVSALIVQIKR